MQIKIIYVLFILFFIFVFILFFPKPIRLQEGLTTTEMSMDDNLPSNYAASDDTTNYNKKPIQIASEMDSYKKMQSIPNMSKHKLSIKTEGDLIDLIENMYNIIVTGEENNSTSKIENTTMDNKIHRNIKSMILLSKITSQALMNITKIDINELFKSYPNLIKAPNDAMRLFEIFFATNALRVFFENPVMDNVNLNAIVLDPDKIKTNNEGLVSIYNSQLTILEAVSDHVQHFHKKIIQPEKRELTFSQDDEDTQLYTEIPTEIKYDYPRSQKFPKKAEQM